MSTLDGLPVAKFSTDIHGLWMHSNFEDPLAFLLAPLSVSGADGTNTRRGEHILSPQGDDIELIGMFL